MDEEQQPISSGSNNVLKIALILIAVAYVLGSGYFLYSLSGRLDRLDAA